MSSTTLWFILAIVLAILELITPGFIIACFAVGALLAIVPSALGWGILWQIIFFIGGTFLTLFLLRPFMRRYANWGKTSRTGIDALLGKEARVVAPIEGRTTRGRIAIDGDEWPAYSESKEESFSVGDRVCIASNDSIVLYVQSIDYNK